MKARAVAEAFYDWARSTGALVEGRGMAAAEPLSLATTLHLDPVDANRTEKRLLSAQLVGVLVDENTPRVTVMTRGKLGPRVIQALPQIIDGVQIEYVGGVSFSQNPPEPIPPHDLTSPPCWLHKGAIACGSSVTVAPVHGAGTLGCLVADKDGRLYGLTNNHVTGDCNHSVVGMYVLSPAPYDADPKGPPPRSIGRHSKFVLLQSGDPGQVQRQDLDAAIFEITDPALVSSMQGDGRYDTPSTNGQLVGGMVVKKIGRTTGETRGRLLGSSLRPISISYKSERFSSLVYFRNVWAIEGIGQPFSGPGDSGSLVVSDDGAEALGLVFGGNDSVSLIVPIEPVLKAFGATLVSGHKT